MWVQSIHFWVTLMQINVVKIGNSRGIRIPKPLLEQAGIGNAVELTFEAGRLVISAVPSGPRAGWGQELDQAMAAQGNDAAELDGFRAPANVFDAGEWTWPADALSSDEPQSAGQ